MKVVGVGDNVVDMYVDKGKMFLGGNALNFSVFASKLQYQSAFVGVFGNDPLADYARAVLKNFKIELQHSKIIAGENGYSRVTIKDGDRVFLDSNKGGVLSPGLKLNENDIHYINQFSVAHFNINGLADSYLSRIRGPKIIYDFSDLYTIEKVKQLAPFIDLGCFSVSHLSRHEIVDLCKMGYSAGIKLVLCTMGSKGAVAYSGNQFTWQPALASTAVDTMGAGDAFITAFGINTFHLQMTKENYQLESDLKESLVLASKFAAQQIKIPGSFDYGTDLLKKYSTL
ncbi:PfkB family carbohydrate kinase [Lentilactobacillus farraginis]|uniref:Fructoselysine kinase n=1 Tax=Lentilactobacillus farraginis DSM 18382 = JCM 14108 TaxID=1423743 RepID=X0PLQ8_9LACO|nr:PfkB family carbohydrate kinase [Lentilactobacillus farraginis]KRM11722.1 ribokinase-like domain-containing protein [Lentilactobacillus farraginis DSM 18382 = JCM 14108]GAF37711.1 fructoselysine kinase [Lentilactobacillus farraginis DSM 18382 = JCM 14108]